MYRFCRKHFARSTAPVHTDHLDAGVFFELCRHLFKKRRVIEFHNGFRVRIHIHEIERSHIGATVRRISIARCTVDNVWAERNTFNRIRKRTEFSAVVYIKRNPARRTLLNIFYNLSDSDGFIVGRGFRHRDSEMKRFRFFIRPAGENRRITND